MLPSTLLRTKLNIPRPTRRLLRRPQLHVRLQHGLEVPLTLVAAPAGFGKSMALATWVREIDRAVAWVSLDASDADPVQFWTYLLTALEEVQPGTSENALAMLQAPQPPPLRAALATLVNALDALDRDLVVVLDDYHLVTSPVVHESLAFVLEHPPEQLHFYLSSRSEPPLPLARMRARSQVNEIRAEELRLRPDEVAAFLATAGIVDLAPADVASLAERTDGWIAGLQLAALALPTHPDPARFIPTFGGGHRHVVSYLAEEVLSAQSPEVQSFLLQTSILDRLCAPLCAAVAEHQGAEAMIEHLQDAGLFVMPLDDEGRWFRYYHLFGDFLRHRLHQLDRAAIPALRRRAAGWLAGEGLTIEAAEHLFAIPDFGEAARLIERAAPGFLIRGEIAALLRLMERLPESSVATQPGLALYQTEAFIYQGQLAAAERRLGQVEEELARLDKKEEVLTELDQRERRLYVGKVASARAAIAAMRGDGEKTLALARMALESLPEDDLSDRAGAVLALGHAHRLTGDVKAAEAVYAEAARISFAVDNLLYGTVALYMRAYTLMWQGRLRQTAELYRELSEVADSRGGATRALSGAAYIGLAQVLYEWGDLEAAKGAADEAIARGRQWANTRDQVNAYVTIAVVFQARGQGKPAQEAIRQAEGLLDEADRLSQSFPWLSPYVAATRARLAIRQGDLEAARRWTERRGLAAEGEVPANPAFPLDFEYLTLARVLLSEGKLDAVENLLARLARGSERAARVGNEVERAMLRALALQARGLTAEAISCLRETLAIAAPEGYLRLFVDEGLPMRSLLLRLRGQEPRTSELRAYLDTLLAAFEGETVSASVGHLEAGRVERTLVEPLSDREREVLRLIAKGRTNQEIARQMVVAVSTVKTHVHNLYGKLEVSDRLQAVVRARELGLLDR